MIHTNMVYLKHVTGNRNVSHPLIQNPNIRVGDSVVINLYNGSAVTTIDYGMSHEL